MTYAAHNTDPHAASRQPSEELRALAGEYVTTEKTGKRQLTLHVTVHELGMIRVQTSEGKVSWELPSDFLSDLENGYIARTETVFVVEETAAHLERELRVTYYEAGGEARLIRVDDCAGGMDDVPLADLPAEDLEAIEEELALPLARLSRKEARAELTATPGEERVTVFEKRSTGDLRVMRYVFDPEARCSFDPREKGLLPVYDLDRSARRFVNLDGVLA